MNLNFSPFHKNVIFAFKRRSVLVSRIFYTLQDSKDLLFILKCFLKTNFFFGCFVNFLIRLKLNAKLFQWAIWRVSIMENLFSLLQYNGSFWLETILFHEFFLQFLIGEILVCKGWSKKWLTDNIFYQDLKKINLSHKG